MTLGPPPTGSALVQDGRATPPWVRWFQLLRDSVRAIETTPVAYAANWEAWGDVNYHDASYYKDSIGRVHLGGLAKNLNAASTVVFTLPVGYRPSKGLIFSAWSSAGAKEVRVEADGRVAFASPTLNGWHSLAGVSFRAE